MNLHNPSGIKFINENIHAAHQQDILSQQHLFESHEDVLRYYIPRAHGLHIMDGEKPIHTNIDFTHKKFLISCLITNAESNLPYLKNLFDDLSRLTLDTKLYFFTNNNLDNTETLLQKWIDVEPKVCGTYAPAEVVYLNSRIQTLSKYRDLCLKESINKFGSDFDYLIIVDTDLIQNINVDILLQSISIDREWSAICGNMTYLNSFVHYDSLALRELNESDNIAEIYPRFLKHYGTDKKWLNKLYIFNNLVEVKAAFGGICIYKMSEILELQPLNNNIFDVKDLPEGTCEHIPLCNSLKHSKFIYGDLTFPVMSDPEEDILPKANVFIPRDAGFFSVFNFYIAHLLSGAKTYPYYNKQLFLQFNQQNNQHFAYWTDSDNCWLDYFEPVSFFVGDVTHIENRFGGMPISLNSQLPPSFTHPAAISSLLKDKLLWNVWREKTHQIYKRYIKFHPDIIHKASVFMTTNFTEQNIIGVHYRHPNKSCESGKIYLNQYFEKIDNLIIHNPGAQIFLATDSDFAILAFTDRYKDRLKYVPDISRSTLDDMLDWGYSLMSSKNVDNIGMIDGRGVELHQSLIQNNGDTKKHGIDLLMEVNCMLQCRWLVHAVSNVSLAISYMNPNIDMITLFENTK